MGEIPFQRVTGKGRSRKRRGEGRRGKERKGREEEGQSSNKGRKYKITVDFVILLS